MERKQINADILKTLLNINNNEFHTEFRINKRGAS